MPRVPVRLIVAAALTCAVVSPLRAEEGVFDPAVARRITPQEVQRRRDAGEKLVVLDTRASISDAIARGAVRVPNERIEAWAKDVPKGALIVAYCT